MDVPSAASLGHTGPAEAGGGQLMPSHGAGAGGQLAPSHAGATLGFGDWVAATGGGSGGSGALGDGVLGELAQPTTVRISARSIPGW